jgi:hypothetical protein
MPAESLTRQILRAHLVDGEPEPGTAIGVRAALMQFEQLPRPRDELEQGANTITATVGGEREIALRHDFTDRDRSVLRCGGLLAYLSEGGETRRGQGVGGRAE